VELLGFEDWFKVFRVFERVLGSFIRSVGRIV
jgi:hypothetical protein